MDFVFEYLRHENEQILKERRGGQLKDWLAFLDAAEVDRQRDRIIGWRDGVTLDNYAVNAGVGEFYHRTAGFVWRFPDPTGLNKARNHQYLYNLAKYGHRQYSRRDKGELAAAQAKVNDSVGPLTPL